MNKTRRILTLLSLVLAFLALTLAPAANAQVGYIGEPPMHRGGSTVYPGGYTGYPYNTGYGQGTLLNFTSAPVTVAHVGVLYLYRPTVSSYSGILPTIALENGPSGMYMDGSGTLNWTPDPSQLGQTFQVSLSARDPYSQVRTFNNYFVAVTAYQAPTTSSGSTGTVVGGSSVTPAFLKQGGAEAVPATYRRSPLATLFGLRGDQDSDLEIANVVAQSGPVNLYDDKPNTNCSVTVSWDTNIASAGQVVYGTKSQSGEDFAYEFTATESLASGKNHQVRLQCLTNETYYFRVVSFSENQRAVTEEMVIFPFKVDGVLASGGARSIGSGTASVFAATSRFFVNPFVLILLLIIATVGIFKIFARRHLTIKSVKNISDAGEPELFIPTAPEITS